MKRPWDSLRDVIEFDDDLLEVVNVSEKINFVFNDVKRLLGWWGLFDSFMNGVTVKWALRVSTSKLTFEILLTVEELHACWRIF